MINEEPTMSVGNGGYTSSAPATGPNAGLDPLLGKKMRRRKKTHEEVDRHNHTPNRLFQYKVKLPTVGDTVIYASSPAELKQKLRLLVNPRYQGEISVERILPADAAKLFMDKRNKVLQRQVFEAADTQMQQQMAQTKMQLLKKQTDLKKQELQKALQAKLAQIKTQTRSGAKINPEVAHYIPDGETINESSGGNIDAIKKIAQGKEPGMLQFQKGGQARMSPQLAQKIWNAYEQLGKQQNRAKFSNAANESETSFQRILNFVGGEG